MMASERADPDNPSSAMSKENNPPSLPINNVASQTTDPSTELESQSTAAALPTGVPFPSSIPAPAPPITANEIQNVDSRPSSPTQSRSGSGSSGAGDEDEKVAAQLAAEARERAQLQKDKEGASKEKSSSDASASSSSIVKQDGSGKKLGFFARRKAKAEADKKSKDKEDEANALPPVGLFAMFRFATRTEIILNMIGLVFAAAAGATQPLMTLIFGRLTNTFNEYGRLGEWGRSKME